MVGEGMNKFAEIFDGQIRKKYIQEQKPLFAPYIKLVDITDVIPEPEEGWYYNESANTFSENNPNPSQIGQSLEERITQLQETAQLNNLITVDAVLSVYEELLLLREEVAELRKNNV